MDDNLARQLLAEIKKMSKKLDDIEQAVNGVEVAVYDAKG